MTETRIAFTGPERRSHLLPMGLFALFGVGLGWVAFVHSHGPDPVRWSIPALLAAIWLPCLFYSINRMTGATLLKPAGMQFQTLVTRRKIPWASVTQIEAQRRSGRGGSWWVIRVHVADRRAVVLPGAMQSQRGQSEAAYRQSVETICAYWRQATGCTDAPVFSE